MFHKLKSVTPLPDYTLLANFSDGSVKSYDFRPLLDRMEVYAPLRESPAFWASAAVDPGGYGVSWSTSLPRSCGSTASPPKARSPVCSRSPTPPAYGVSAKAPCAKPWNTVSSPSASMSRNSASNGSSPAPPWNASTAIPLINSRHTPPPAGLPAGFFSHFRWCSRCSRRACRRPDRSRSSPC